MSSEYRLHPEVASDLFEIWSYIAADNREAADRVESEILEVFEELVQFPERGHHRPDLTSHALRFWRVRKYLIAYAPAEHPLLIVAVLHGMRSPRIMSTILQDRD